MVSGEGGRKGLAFHVLVIYLFIIFLNFEKDIITPLTIVQQLLLRVFLVLFLSNFALLSPDVIKGEPVTNLQITNYALNFI